MPFRYHIGCAGWSLPGAVGTEFPPQGSHLHRYAARLPAVEINSTFHRPHLSGTYARWADSVPDGFCFSVKLPKAITHQARLVDAAQRLDEFLAGATALGEKLGCLLAQLPPSLPFDAPTAEAFLVALRERYAGAVALEPRHSTWFEPPATGLLVIYRVGRVAADPAIVPAAAEPGGWLKTAYFRLHGSPRMYYSAYDDPYLDALAGRLRAAAHRAEAVWCIFDNTTLGAATGDALRLLERLE